MQLRALESGSTFIRAAQCRLGLLLCVFSLTGCQAMTVISGGEYSPSKRFWAGVTTYGAPGRSFDDRTEKKLVVFVIEHLPPSREQKLRQPIPELRQESAQPIDASGTREVYHKNLKVIAGNVCSMYEWHGETNVVIRLFECDPDATTADEIRRSMRPLSPPVPAQLRLCLNPASGLFEECETP